ncbi:MarR family winged helix-turn-helix transcriptional regulator [Scopulibacillus cellulosilyticus]|uniref:MarR family winged helix-turn-helix transcriptional regulator n=1 Tax=Scopulibacillus cellulosilyticus TaxID=2665665 RepID=A0ABW2Q6R0_9BACL
MEERKEIIHQFEENFHLLIKKFKKDIGEIFGKEMTIHEFLFLKQLSDGKPQTGSALSKKMKVSASYITSLVDILIKKGYINRNRSFKDRRIVELTITESGAEVLNKIDNKKIEYMSRKLAVISDLELEILNLLLNKIKR